MERLWIRIFAIALVAAAICGLLSQPGVRMRATLNLEEGNRNVTVMYLAWIPPVGFFENYPCQQAGAQISYITWMVKKVMDWYKSLPEHVQERLALRIVEFVLVQQPRNSSAYEQAGVGWTGRSVLSNAEPLPMFRIYSFEPLAPQPHKRDVIEPISFSEFRTLFSRHIDYHYGLLGPFIHGENHTSYNAVPGRPAHPGETELMNETWTVGEWRNQLDPMPSYEELLKKREVAVSFWYDVTVMVQDKSNPVAAHYDTCRLHIIKCPRYRLFVEMTRYSAEIEQAADYFIRENLGDSFVALHWRAGDRFHAEMPYLAGASWKWSTPGAVAKFINKAMRKAGTDKVFVMTNSGPAFRAELRKLVNYTALPPGKPSEEVWTMTLEQAIASRAKIFVVSGNSYNLASAPGLMVVDRRIWQLRYPPRSHMFTKVK